MIYLTCVDRALLDPVVSFEDEHKSEQDSKIKYNMYRYWNALSVGYAQCYSIVMRTITLHTIYVYGTTTICNNESDLVITCQLVLEMTFLETRLEGLYNLCFKKLLYTLL